MMKQISLEITAVLNNRVTYTPIVTYKLGLNRRQAQMHRIILKTERAGFFEECFGETPLHVVVVFPLTVKNQHWVTGRIMSMYVYHKSLT